MRRLSHPSLLLRCLDGHLAVPGSRRGPPGSQAISAAGGGVAPMAPGRLRLALWSGCIGKDVEPCEHQAFERGGWVGFTGTAPSLPPPRKSSFPTSEPEKGGIRSRNPRINPATQILLGKAGAELSTPVQIPPSSDLGRCPVGVEEPKAPVGQQPPDSGVNQDRGGGDYEIAMRKERTDESSSSYNSS